MWRTCRVETGLDAFLSDLARPSTEVSIWACGVRAPGPPATVFSSARGVDHAKMRSGTFSLTARIIFSLSALAASLFAGSSAPVQPSHDSAPRFFRFVAPFVISVSDHASPSVPYPPTPDAAFALAALTATPFRSSLWLVSSSVALDLRERRHQREFLRC